jgi:hypothetical protein
MRMSCVIHVTWPTMHWLESEEGQGGCRGSWGGGVGMNEKKVTCHTSAITKQTYKLRLTTHLKLWHTPLNIWIGGTPGLRHARIIHPHCVQLSCQKTEMNKQWTGTQPKHNRNNRRAREVPHVCKGRGEEGAVVACNSPETWGLGVPGLG